MESNLDRWDGITLALLLPVDRVHVDVEPGDLSGWVWMGVKVVDRVDVASNAEEKSLRNVQFSKPVGTY